MPDGSGTLVGFIVNHNDTADTLAAISVNGQRAELVSDAILTKNSPMIFEGDSANAKAKVAALGAKPGYRVPVVLYFVNGGKAELDALVVANTGSTAPSCNPDREQSELTSDWRGQFQSWLVNV